jgi:hypothetical protein
MSTPSKDALLVVAKVATIVVRVGLVIGMIGIAAAVLLIGGAGLSDHIAMSFDPEGLGAVTGGAIVVLALTMVSLGLMYDFVTRLAQIIDTVGEGDPFTDANAARLNRMGWLAVIVQLLAIPAMLLSSWLETEVDPSTFYVDSDLSLSGIGLALVLFILARVFRKGTEMRAELEGTV